MAPRGSEDDDGDDEAPKRGERHDRGEHRHRRHHHHDDRGRHYRKHDFEEARRDDNDRHRAPRKQYEEHDTKKDRYYKDRDYKDTRQDRRRNGGDDNRGRYYDRRNRSGSKDDRGNRDRGNRSRKRSREPSADPQNYSWGKSDKSDDKKKPPVEKQKPNFQLTGKLTEETNTYRGVVIKYSEPPEARKPKRRWRLYPFKGEKAMQTLYIHRESAYLMGRDRKVVDLPLDHPSCSKQHAVLQYRLVPFTREDGSTGKRVRPYLIDLDSANGTYINNQKVEPRKYIELIEKDVIKFGYSTREYVLLHENSKDEAQDDDVKQEEVAVKTETEEAG